MAAVGNAKRPRPAPMDSDVSLAHVVTPGDTIATEPGFMRGHGTIMEGEQLVSSVAGIVERVNKVVRVHPVHARYA